MRFFYILILLVAPFLVYAGGDNTSDIKAAEKVLAAKVSGEDQQSLLAPKANSEQILTEITENQALFESMQAKLPSIKQEKLKIPDAQPPLSEDDKSAQSSPIFTPGGAPRPVPQERPPVRPSPSARDNKKDSDKDKPDSGENSTPDDSADATSDSGAGSSLPDNNSYNNPSYPPPSSSTGTTTLKATFKPSSGAYKYSIKATEDNPFTGVADNHLKLTVNGSVYTKMALCTDKSYTNCQEAKALPWAISTKPDNVYYLEQIIDKLTLQVPYISAQLTKKDGSTQNIQFLFYKSSLCTKGGDNLSCTIPTNGASFEINKT